VSMIEYDTMQYGSVERTICAGACKDSRITAMWIDTVSNAPMYPSDMVFPWTPIYQNVSAWIRDDVRDRYERDRSVPSQPFAPRVTQQWYSDYPGDTHHDRPQPLSFLAAAIVAARRAAGIADGTLPVQYGGQAGNES
jgi:hypothetical protein